MFIELKKATGSDQCCPPDSFTRFALNDFPFLDRLPEAVDATEAYGAVLENGQFKLYADTDRAVGYYLLDRQRGNSPDAWFSQPDFRIRGVVEGFYGNPWSLQQRLQIIGRLARLKYNTFFYGPKDDPFVCENWRQPYDEQGIEYLNRLKRVCDGHHMDLHCLLAPAFSIEFSSRSDFSALMAKYRQLYAIGIRAFGLLFDDVQPVLQHETDKARYTDLCQAHIDLANRVYTALKDLDKQISLTVCPTEYWGRGAYGYLTRFGRAMPADCAIFYTGDQICSRGIPEENACWFQETTGHKPLYWDNYPVNDAGMTREYHIGPILNRGAELWRHAQGLVANPMSLIESSLIALGCIADYLADATGYEPQRSHRQSIAQVAGSDFVQQVQLLHSFCYKSCLSGHFESFPADGPQSSHHETLLKWIETGQWAAIKDFAASSLRAFHQLEHCANHEFLDESRPWRASAVYFCQSLIESLAVSDTHPDEARNLLLNHLNQEMDVMKYETRKLIEQLSGT
jgi:hypothetical protein